MDRSTAHSNGWRNSNYVEKCAFPWMFCQCTQHSKKTKHPSECIFSKIYNCVENQCGKEKGRENFFLTIQNTSIKNQILTHFSNFLSVHEIFSLCALLTFCTTLFVSLCNPFRHSPYHYFLHTTRLRFPFLQTHHLIPHVLGSLTACFHITL